jgi:hypothetical protein
LELHRVLPSLPPPTRFCRFGRFGRFGRFPASTAWGKFFEELGRASHVTVTEQPGAGGNEKLIICVSMHSSDIKNIKLETKRDANVTPPSTAGKDTLHSFLAALHADNARSL